MIRYDCYVMLRYDTENVSIVGVPAWTTKFDPLILGCKLKPAEFVHATFSLSL